jgi:hypothetical protein
MIAVQVLVFVLGVALVAATLLSAVRSFVLPRAAPTLITTTIFVLVSQVFDLFAGPTRPYARRDRILAMYAPIALLLLPFVWLVLISTGYTAILWAVGVRPLREAVITSGSSLFTLGFSRPEHLVAVLLAFTEALIGLGLVALLISYLPSIYAAFARREAEVTMLESLAGSPPSPIEMLLRYQRIDGWSRIGEMWARWQSWFADVEESHTSIAALCFFRSPQPDRSWVVAAGCILDAAALSLSCLTIEYEPEAPLCIRTGYLALQHIADFFAMPYESRPQPGDPISIDRSEFDEVWDDFAAANLPLKPDRDRAWRDFAGWRVNYDVVLLGLAGLTAAPPARWSGDRSAGRRRPPLFRRMRSPVSRLDNQ